MESISHTLANGWTKLGHKVTVVTETPCDTERITNYKVIRQPDSVEINQLVESHDLMHSNGASMRYLPIAWKHAKPFTCKHATYHLLCIDGCGWVNGQPAPLNPWGSLLHHWRLFGAKTALGGFLRLLRRCLAARLVSGNIAITKYQANKQWAPRQIIIYNPIEVGSFAVANLDQALNDLAQADSTFTFLGRLITEKGVDDLLRAFALLCQKNHKPDFSLKIIGGGPEQANLKQLALDLGISQQVRWLGEITGDDLSKAVKKAGICILPSAWEEPMGIACQELMCAGKPLIVSAQGGLAEGVGEGGLTFPNRDYQALAEVMEKLYTNIALQKELVKKALERSRHFNPQESLEQYLDLFAQLLHQDKAQGSS